MEAGPQAQARSAWVSGRSTHGCPRRRLASPGRLRGVGSPDLSCSAPRTLLSLLPGAALQARFLLHLRPHRFLRGRRRVPCPTRPARRPELARPRSAGTGSSRTPGCASVRPARRRGQPRSGTARAGAPKDHTLRTRDSPHDFQGQRPRAWERARKYPRTALAPTRRSPWRSVQYPSAPAGSHTRPHAEPPHAEPPPASRGAALALRGSWLRGSVATDYDVKANGEPARRTL